MVLVLAFWTFFGGLMAGELYFQARTAGRSPSLARLLAHFLAWAYTWALFTPLILWLRRRFTFERGRWISSLALHLPASLLLAWLASLLFVAVGQALGRLAPGVEALFQTSLQTFVLFLHFDPLIYWIIIGLGYLVQHYQESRARELRASVLETQLVEARLQALEMQLHPHFLFNALNTIAALVRTNKSDQAVRVVTGLGQLLRRALDGAGAQVVPLEQEVEFIERYLEIEQIRFGQRLQVEMSIEPETREAHVPHLILQPLVENAIQYAIAPRASGGKVRIVARRSDDRLQLSVHDDGPGLPGGSTATARDGVGLSTTRERLQQLYGDDHSFMIFDAEGGGVTAQLEIPFQHTPGEPERGA